MDLQPLLPVSFTTKPKAPALLFSPDQVPKDLSKELIVLARVDVPPGQGLLTCAVSSLESSGYTGAILGAKCVPPVESPVHAGVYWSMAMNALRTKKSQTVSQGRLVVGVWPRQPPQPTVASLCHSSLVASAPRSRLHFTAQTTGRMRG